MPLISLFTFLTKLFIFLLAKLISAFLLTTYVYRRKFLKPDVFFSVSRTLPRLPISINNAEHSLFKNIFNTTSSPYSLPLSSAPSMNATRANSLGFLTPKFLRHGRLMAVLTLLALTSSGLSVVPAGAAEPDKKITGGISIGATRVIYNEADNGAVVRVINTSTVPFLIQTWVESYKGFGAEKSAELPAGVFVTTPPLYRQDKGENSVRIVRARGDFAQDRESVFWLNIKSIPSTDKPAPGTNYVQFAFNTRIKLFYRPAGLPGNPTNAYKTLTFSRSGNTLTATNTTVYNVTINNLKVGGVEINDADQRMVPPQGTQSWTLPGAAVGKTVTYVSLNDFGGLTPPITVTAQ